MIKSWKVERPTSKANKGTVSMIARTDIITNSLAPHLNNVHPAPPLLLAFLQHSFLSLLQAHYTSRLPTRSAANRGVASSPTIRSPAPILYAIVHEVMKMEFRKKFLFPSLSVANWFPGHMAKGAH